MCLNTGGTGRYLSDLRKTQFHINHRLCPIVSQQVYQCNAARFKKIVNGVEAKSVSPEKIAKKTRKILQKKNPKFAYAINRNKLLLLLNALPKRLQFFAIKKILK